MEVRENIIEVENLVKRFGHFTANDNLTFSVRRGEIFGFLGANGAGKTTAIKILCGLWKPTSGKISVAGFDVYTETEKIKQNIGYMSQRFSLYEDLTPRENFRFYGGIYGLSRQVIAEKTGLLLKRLDLLEHGDRPVSSLPLGWKQKLAFSVAIMHQPAIVFLDEPTSGVDPVTRRQFWDLIYDTARGGITVFLTTHYMDEAEYCERISIMVDGRIRALGAPSELKMEFGTGSIDELFIKLARESNKQTDGHKPTVKN
jgi:ABC-2 type transport system ATP-binding protein